MNRAFEKAGRKGRTVVYRVSSGAPTGTYLVLSAMDSLKSLDVPAGAMSMAEAYGADMSRYDKLVAETIISSEQTLFAINPKMSNPPKEYLTTDTDFWAPKTKVVATTPAAKPAGGQ